MSIFVIPEKVGPLKSGRARWALQEHLADLEDLRLLRLDNMVNLGLNLRGQRIPMPIGDVLNEAIEAVKGEVAHVARERLGLEDVHHVGFCQVPGSI